MIYFLRETMKTFFKIYTVHKKVIYCVKNGKYLSPYEVFKNEKCKF